MATYGGGTTKTTTHYQKTSGVGDTATAIHTMGATSFGTLYVRKLGGTIQNSKLKSNGSSDASYQAAIATKTFSATAPDTYTLGPSDIVYIDATSSSYDLIVCEERPTA